MLWGRPDGAADLSTSDKGNAKSNSLGRLAIVRDSRVGVCVPLVVVTPSSTEPLKFCVNLAGPPVKPKYSLMSDSGQVP